MMGALYVDFGLYVTVKFKAQVFMNLIKYEPTLYDDEFPLLTAGVQQSVYDFVYEPDADDVLYVWDDDANSTNGISMSLPEIYRTMKRNRLVSRVKNPRRSMRKKTSSLSLTTRDFLAAMAISSWMCRMISDISAVRPVSSGRTTSWRSASTIPTSPYR